MRTFLFDDIYITYVLKIQSFQSQREICTILSCATNLYSVWFYRVIMTYLVKNDSENSDYSTNDNDNGIQDVDSTDSKSYLSRIHVNLIIVKFVITWTFW